MKRAGEQAPARGVRFCTLGYLLGGASSLLLLGESRLRRCPTLIGNRLAHARHYRPDIRILGDRRTVNYKIATKGGAGIR